MKAKPRILFLVTSDPAASPRPAEAIRIAAGVSVWKKASVTVCLLGSGVAALAENEGDWAQHWSILTEVGAAIYVGKTHHVQTSAAAPAKPLTPARLAELAAQHTAVLRF